MSDEPRDEAPLTLPAHIDNLTTSPHGRGDYGADEERTSLIDRVTGQWTSMEAHVYNAVTQHWDRGVKPLFSRRLGVVSRMLEVFDAYVHDRDTAPSDRTIGDIIRAALPSAHIQFMFESISNISVKRIGGKRGVEQTIVTFATPSENLTPDHVLWLSLSDEERREPRYGGRKPPYVPVIVWVPAAIYEGTTTQEEEPRGSQDT